MLRLSYRTDKLWAIARLAGVMQRHTKQKCLAGLWEETLLLDMCWSRIQTPISESPEILKTNDPCFQSLLLYIAPTWFWASVDPLVFWDSRFTLLLSSPDNFHFYSPEHNFARVLEARCTPAGPSSFGPVLDGYIMFECCLIPISFIQEDDAWCLRPDIRFQEFCQGHDISCTVKDWGRWPDLRAFIWTDKTLYMTPMLSLYPTDMDPDVVIYLLAVHRLEWKPQSGPHRHRYDSLTFRWSS